MLTAEKTRGKHWQSKRSAVFRSLHAVPNPEPFREHSNAGFCKYASYMDLIENYSQTSFFTPLLFLAGVANNERRGDYQVKNVKGCSRCTWAQKLGTHCSAYQRKDFVAGDDVIMNEESENHAKVFTNPILSCETNVEGTFYKS